MIRSIKRYDPSTHGQSINLTAFEQLNRFVINICNSCSIRSNYTCSFLQAFFVVFQWTARAVFHQKDSEKNSHYFFFAVMMTVRIAEANIESFLSYFNELEDYLNVATDSTITFEQVVEFMRRLKDARELNT